jgi:hypothetical protein
VSASVQTDDRDPVLWVNDGQTCLGMVYEAGCEFEAVAASGEALGRFPDARHAASVIRAHTVRSAH